MFLFKKKRRFYCGHKSFWVGYTTEIIKRKTYDGYNIQEKEDVKFYLKTSQNNESEYSMITRVFKNGIIRIKDHFGAVLLGSHFHRSVFYQFTLLEAGSLFLTISDRFHDKLRGKGIHRLGTNAVQPNRFLEGF